MPRYGIPAQDVKRLLDHLRGGDKPAHHRGLDELPSVAGLVACRASTAITRLAADLRGPEDVRRAVGHAHDLSARPHRSRPQMSPGTGDRRSHAGDRGLAVPEFPARPKPVATGSPIQTLLDRVRNLVLLAEERDLRQVPDAALQMDAVRLMTVHGSKGLEFEAVHIPGS